MARRARPGRGTTRLRAASCSASLAAMRPLLVLFAALMIAGAAHAAPARHARPQPFASSAWKPVLPFIEDDLDRALALAKERKLPVFIEGWAPW